MDNLEEVLQHGFVFHGSYKQRLKKININPDKQDKVGKDCLFVSEYKVVAAFFAATYGRDFTCELSKKKGVFIIREKFKDAFNFRFQNRSGSVYRLLGKNLSQEQDARRKEEKPLWTSGGEWYSLEESFVLHEDSFDCAAEYLKQFVEKGELVIKECEHEISRHDYESWKIKDPKLAEEFAANFPLSYLPTPIRCQNHPPGF